MKRKPFMLIFACVLVLTSMLSYEQAFDPVVSAQTNEETHPISSYYNKWSVIHEAEQQPELDGVLDDPVWDNASRLSDFVTPYFNEETDIDTGVQLAYDNQALYIAFDYESEEEDNPLANIEFLLSASEDEHYRIPVEVEQVSPRYNNNLGSNIETVENFQSEVVNEDGNTMVEVAVPLDEFGVDQVSEGEEWGFNIIAQHEMGTKPLLSWIPIRRTAISYTGGSSATLNANVADEDRLGRVFLDSLPEDDLENWEPEDFEMAYASLTEKVMTFKRYDMNPKKTDIELNWKEPFGDWQPITDYSLKKEEEMLAVSFEHPQARDKGWYQLQLIVHRDNKAPRHTIISFDRDGLIKAGENLFEPDNSPDGEVTKVTHEPASERVKQLKEMMPEKAGFRFTGLPERPDLHPDRLYNWNPDNPDVLTSTESDLTYPNEQFPEDQVMTVTNRQGETVEYPYYEDEDGKRYFISGHLWYLQRNYVLGQLTNIANDDPLGAARLLYHLVDIYKGWVPTNEYPWHNQPIDPNTGPPYHWWGGTWSRWSAAELDNFRSVISAYESVKQTNAFEVLSQEVGEDVEETIIKEMFEPTIEHYRTFPVLHHNMEYVNALGLAELGKALNDPSYIHEAMEWAEGFAMNTYLFDGFFQETTVSYHNQSTGGVFNVMNTLDGWSDPAGYTSPLSGRHLDDLDMTKEFPVLKQAQEIPNLLAYPNGKYYPLHDTWAVEQAGDPQFDAGSLLLPASGVARLARGSVKEEENNSIITYDFPSLEITEQTADDRLFADSGTVQFEANSDGHSITFAFDVEEADVYKVDLKAFQAPSYGSYDVLIDGEKITNVDFYGTSSTPRDFVTLTEMELMEGSHEISFENTGRHEDATNFKMGVIQLALLNEQAQEERDEDSEADEIDPTQLYLNFLPKYGHHHYDPLNLSLFAEGQELLPDIGYTHTKYRRLINSTMGHNTVVVDSQDAESSGQAAHSGNIEVFAPVDDEVQVLRASQESSYAQTDEYSREPWLIQFPDATDNEGYVLDLFRVSGGERHEYTLNGVANHDASFETDIEFSEYGPYLLPEGVEVREPETETDYGDAEGHYYGYINVRDVEKATVNDGHYDLTLTTQDDDGQGLANMKITGLVEAGENELFVGESPSVRATRLHGTARDTNDYADQYTLPKMVLRREGNDLTSNFVTVLEPYANGAEAKIETMERLTPDQSVEGDLAVKVTYGDTTDIILSSLDPEQPLVVGDMTLNGKMGMIRMTDGQVEDMYLVGGTSLKKGDRTVTDEGPITGTVSDVHRIAAGKGENAFVTDTAVSAAMKGNTLVITHPNGKTHGYEISGVKTDGGNTLIEIGDMEPGFSINENGSSELHFYPFTRWSGETTFRIENSKQLNE